MSKYLPERDTGKTIALVRCTQMILWLK